MRSLALIAAVVVWTAPANAQLLRVSKPGDTLKTIERNQRINLAHNKYVCHYGGGENKRWSCRAVRWLSRELHETQEALRPPVAYGAPLCGASCINCESSGNPNAWNGDDYWGLYQFDRQTWTRHGGLASEYGHAPAWRQHQVAQRIRYDAWPRC